MRREQAPPAFPCPVLCPLLAWAGQWHAAARSARHALPLLPLPCQAFDASAACRMDESGRAALGRLLGAASLHNPDLGYW